MRGRTLAVPVGNGGGRAGEGWDHIQDPEQRAEFKRSKDGAELLCNFPEGSNLSRVH